MSDKVAFGDGPVSRPARSRGTPLTRTAPTLPHHELPLQAIGFKTVRMLQTKIQFQLKLRSATYSGSGLYLFTLVLPSWSLDLDSLNRYVPKTGSFFQKHVYFVICIRHVCLFLSGPRPPPPASAATRCECSFLKYIVLVRKFNLSVLTNYYIL